MGVRTRTREERFWDKVDQQDPEDCWEWHARRHKQGYGLLSEWDGSRRSRALAHRVSWEIANGPISDGLHVLHRCDNPPCVNPAHLFLGTPADNSADMVQKGRHQRGEEKPTAVLTEAQVREAHALYQSGMPLPSIAAALGVGKSCLSKIRREQTWSHLDLNWSTRPGKLDARKVREIRRRSSAGESRTTLGAEFSVSPHHIGAIVRRDAWKAVG